MEVIYEFDRTHENLPDEYWTKSLDLGIQIIFNEEQFVDTISINLADKEGFTPAILSESDVMVFESKKGAVSYAIKKVYQSKKAKLISWVKNEIGFDLSMKTILFITNFAINCLLSLLLWQNEKSAEQCVCSGPGGTVQL